MNATNPVQDLDTALQLALAQHQRGELENARSGYLAILEIAPRNADALHLLGVVARQQGDPVEAVALISRAIAIGPIQSTMHCNLGAAFQDLGDPAKALASYDAALALTPAYALAWSNRGNSLRQLDKLEAACASYERALHLRPAYPEALCNLAIALHGLGRYDAALGAAEAALAQRPRYADALCASGNALHALHHDAQAVARYDQALALDGKQPQAWCWRGIALQQLGQCEEAVASYTQAIALRPDFADAHQFLGNALRALGRDAEALAAWRTALSLGGDADALQFAIAALDAGTAPAAAPAGYVAALFDQYAGHFDAHLVDRLDYRTPALIGAALDALPLPDQMDVVDLGCGTGLCAPVLRARARMLTGVDLSSKMLDQARARADYDVLACAELTDWLAGRTAAFDLAVAADVLVYIGDLSAVMQQVAGALRPQGWFVCSVESHAGTGFVLHAAHRYAHARGYVDEVAAAAGLRVHAATPATLRRDRDVPVDGLIVTLQKA